MDPVSMAGIGRELAVFSRCLLRTAAALALLNSLACATELGASVYPAGVETVMSGMVPAPGASLLAEFTNFYEANALVDGQGHAELAGFHLRVAAVAVKFVHNWGVHVLGGTLERRRLTVPLRALGRALRFRGSGRFRKSGPGAGGCSLSARSLELVVRAGCLYAGIQI